MGYINRPQIRSRFLESPQKRAHDRFIAPTITYQHFQISGTLSCQLRPNIHIFVVPFMARLSLQPPPITLSMGWE